MSAAALSDLLRNMDNMSAEEFKAAFVIADHTPPPDIEDQRPASDRKKVRKYGQLNFNGEPCHYCGVATTKIQCDHVVPVAQGGSDEPSNLVPACSKCNGLKRDRTPEEFRHWLLVNRLADPMDDYIKRVERLSHLLDSELVETLTHAAGILKQIALTAEVEFHYERDAE